MSGFLPKKVDNVLVPPIKMQGIKTDLVNFISSSIRWEGDGRWIEPFLGTGVVLFNVLPKRALVSDANKYVVRFYKKLKSGGITPGKVRGFLEKHGAKLREEGEDYYYEMRDKFNETGDELHMLFLNRSCYNGMMRFNLSGEYNVPFCRKPNRFRKAYVTKIVNQVKKVVDIFETKDIDWEFVEQDWTETVNLAGSDDFMYLDPPYVGRHTGYVGKWEEEDAEDLANSLKESDAGFALSMWLENEYRKNDHIKRCWSDYPIRSYSHFYHVGSTEDLRNEMEEGLIVKKGYDSFSE
jgi:DNA adenine methylase